MRHAWAKLYCAVIGHRFEVLERAYAKSRRNELLGALCRCARCEVYLDWRSPGDGPIFSTERP